MILTPDQLDADCLLVINRLRTYSLDLQMLIAVLYSTGCREGEVLDRSRWTSHGPDAFRLQPQKGNPTRDIPSAILPARFISYLTDPSWRAHVSSLMNLRRMVDKFSDYPLATCGDKQISTHRFRHNRIKQLRLSGATMAEIKLFMGLTSTSTVNGYVDSEIEA